MKDDLISRQAAIEAMTSGVILVTNNNVDAVKKVMELFIDKIKNLPAAEPERKPGRWLRIKGEQEYVCGECGQRCLETIMLLPKWDYCPSCGAYMGGEQNGSDKQTGGD